MDTHLVSMFAGWWRAGTHKLPVMNQHVRCEMGKGGQVWWKHEGGTSTARLGLQPVAGTAKPLKMNT